MAGHDGEGADDTVLSGASNVHLSLSGQVNRGVLFVDDGNQTEILHVDNDNSSTRFRLIGTADYNEDISIGSVIEVQFESNSTADIKIDGSAPGGNNSFTERKLELYLDSKRFGRLWLGQGDTASNGSSEVDLSGTGVIGYSGVTDMAGGIEFQDAGVAGPTIGSALSNFDGLSRDDRIRYDTPKFGGFQLSVSHAESRKSDVAARFSGDIGAGLKVAAAVAYAVNGDVDSQINGSLSVRHESGFNVTGAAGTRDMQVGAVNSTRDPFFWYVKVGYIWGGGIGNTAFAIDFIQADEVASTSANDEATSYGAFVVQAVDKIGTELYLGARQYQLDRVGSNFDDVTAVMAGARVKF
jgi:predicted porin